MEAKAFGDAGENAALVEELFIAARVAMLRLERQYPVQVARAFTVAERETLQQARQILGALDSDVLAVLESRGQKKISHKVLTNGTYKDILIKASGNGSGHSNRLSLERKRT